MNKKIVKYIIPNFLTIFRIIMTTLLIRMMQNGSFSVQNFVLLNIFIFISDLSDGKLARYFHAETHMGEILDIIADIFYVLSLSVIVYKLKVISLYYIYMMLLEFCVFIITSNYLNNGKSYFIFDALGRILAVLYYIIPSVLFTAFIQNRYLYMCLYKNVMLLTVLLTTVVIAYRLGSCFNKLKYNSIKNQIYEEEIK